MRAIHNFNVNAPFCSPLNKNHKPTNKGPFLYKLPLPAALTVNDLSWTMCDYQVKKGLETFQIEKPTLHLVYSQYTLLHSHV